MNPATLYQVANTAVLPFWIMLLVIPRHPLTARMVRSGAISCFIAVFYIVAMLLGEGMSTDGFGTLEGVRSIFQNDWFLLGAWLHYLAFDLYVGASITSHYVQHGGSRLMLGVELFFTLMLGPVGLLLHKLRVFLGTRLAKPA
ncbi:MAG TPA: ABA4-like family protein [Oligoflexus sp.]|uniref:ABA4-like family protein n=1 Tax=Oligoflexus sp. TaxID=1971216 RepID=UPI002D5237F6|nr:ABA4-like family protein [Oligoflexus sp.]HYX38709.1 ABA4-like family protein [Oligoflexus sp.]